jgi:hypothetical protein
MYIAHIKAYVDGMGQMHAEVRMKRKPVESSMISSVGYDPVSEILEVEFNSGGVFQYGEVSEETYRQLISADSKGGYMRDCIIDQYPYVRVRRTSRRNWR